MTKVIPISSVATLKASLRKYLEREKIDEMSPSYEAIKHAFESGWNSSKSHTFEILEHIGSEENNGPKQ